MNIDDTDVSKGESCATLITEEGEKRSFRLTHYKRGFKKLDFIY